MFHTLFLLLHLPFLVNKDFQYCNLMPENEISINREQFTTKFSLNLKVFDRVQKIIEVKLDE